jgi:hypothetical protein
MYESTRSLREAETQCLERFRKKAAALRAADPSLTARVAFGRAVESLPAVTEVYQRVHHQLLLAGHAPLPLR